MKSTLQQMFKLSTSQAKQVPPLRLINQNRDHLYKIQAHKIKPECFTAYKQLCGEELQKLHKDDDVPVELMASFVSLYGKQDMAYHFWKYKGNGYDSHDETLRILEKKPDFCKFRSERAKMLQSRESDLVYEFAFWPQMQTTKTNTNIYELRTYHLHPGTLPDFAGQWNTVFGNKYRSDKAVGGFFGDIGKLNVIYHLWSYKDLADRLETRNRAWSNSGADWQRVVSNTQRLCKSMESVILEAMNRKP